MNGRVKLKKSVVWKCLRLLDWASLVLSAVHLALASLFLVQLLVLFLQGAGEPYLLWLLLSILVLYVGAHTIKEQVCLYRELLEVQGDWMELKYRRRREAFKKVQGQLHGSAAE